ncbi:NAD(P)-dependent dehydrogenase, short-chain alcohol dehydrogenase family [Catalinimonas alkaloidigena]|uniref:NAD(P)-dependent dehydrogenase, short-chain alcohol dehydrogenase family n=1 Tax=Catalinimonas alkaloidigena TaxID=1075417 RepID=A0A1G9B677_9BACT|nr:SDR family NAD(P)-dependent oxidoreductase [Catalinimonas alkaloidigena]SDK34385.1 NAD(P)-dependent dehydrogenase, short-chain alcohol dehydrogenase family [Catalinimonas alkaloidigena]
MNSIVITGATSGIGFECASRMAQIAKNEQIVIPARNIKAGKEVIEKIKDKTGHKNLTSLELDLASLQSIRNFSESFAKEKSNAISILINNAGVQNIGETQFTTDGFEQTFGVNHLGAFALTMQLLPFMKDDAHIIFTSSETHDPALKTPIEPPIYTSTQELAFPKETSEKQNIVGQRRYSTSKLCNIMTTYELQERLKHTNIRVNAYDPGLTPGTGLARTYTPVMRFLWKNVFPVLTLFKSNIHTPAQAGKHLANLAYCEKYKDLKGIYFSDGKVVRTSVDSYNKDFQKDLWSGSLELTKTTFIE